jgi:hypothetical protein
VFGLMHNSRPNFLVRQAAANKFHQSSSRPVVLDDVAFVFQRIEIGAKGEAAGDVDRKALQVVRYVDQCPVMAAFCQRRCSRAATWSSRSKNLRRWSVFSACMTSLRWRR